jgi:catechol 2,3-dioxygenase-like lactoylglutathione lyase family enzyme
MGPLNHRWSAAVYRGSMIGIGRLGEIVIDCPDPMESAEFYSALTGLPISDDAEDDWVALINDNGPDIAFQLVEYYEPPVWPSHTSPQRAHLDIYVEDLRRAEREVLRLGAVKCEEQPGRSFTVFLDPAGHPFCLVLEP